MDLEAFKECYEGAEDEFKKGRYNVATMLYYKALSILCDFYIKRETNRIVTNHTERFDILKGLDYKAFKILSPLFKSYRETYAGTSTRTDAEGIKDGLKRVAKLIGVEIR